MERTQELSINNPLLCSDSEGDDRVISVIFPAAGQGRRLKAGASVNKSLLTLAGKPMLVWTLLKFSAVDDVAELVVVVPADEVTPVERLLAKVPKLKPVKVVAGGAERQFSVANGLKAARLDADLILVHDAARPLVTAATIERVIAGAKASGAAVAAVPEKNTIKVVNPDGFVTATPDRATLWEVQTPQGFRREVLMDAYLAAMRDGFVGTDDASLVERLGRPVQVVDGNAWNFKITTPEDLLAAESFLRNDFPAKAKEGIDVAAGLVAERVDELRQWLADGLGR